jgi:molecular chaperone DnaK
MVHSVRKSLTVYGDKLDGVEKDKFEAAAKDLEVTLKSEDKEAIEAKTNALMTVSQKLGEKMYEAQQAAGGAAQPEGSAENAQSKPANDDNVVDAEVKEVKKG